MPLTPISIGMSGTDALTAINAGFTQVDANVTAIAGKVTSITGTANQITVTGTTTPTLSLPATVSGLTSVTSTTFVGALTGLASLNLPLTGGTLTGKLTIPAGTSADAGLSFSGTPEGFYQIPGGYAFSVDVNTPVFMVRYRSAADSGAGLGLVQNAFIGWGGYYSAISTPDLLIGRDAAGVFAQRNGTNAQTFRVYGTYTDASNYVRASLAASSTLVTLAAETAGTGADNVDINLTTAGTGLVNLATQSATADAALIATHSARIKIGGTEYKILLATP